MTESEKDPKADPAAGNDAGDRPPSETGSGGEAPPDDAPAKEIGGRGGPDPTRYGDWEIDGRCVDF